MPPRVILADDHVMVAQGLGRLLAPEVDIVATVSDGGQLVESARRLQPDVVVADMNMPVMTGLEAMRLLKAEGLKARFIFLTINAEARLASEAIRSGAAGYVLKQAAGEELIEAIRSVMAGRTYLTPLITKDVLWALAQPAEAEKGALTPRQREVLRRIADGKRMKEIATDLNISVRTVENHKQELFHVTGCQTTAELIKFAIRQGLASS